MDAHNADPRTKHTDDDFPSQVQEQPGLTGEMTPEPDHGENRYRGSGLLRGRRALITGGDSGIGRAVAIAYAREGADVAVVAMTDEKKDADDTVTWIEDAGTRGRALLGDLREEEFATGIVAETVDAFGGLDLLVLNAGYQKERDGVENLETAEFDRTFRTNLYSMIWTARAAIAHLKPGASIIVTSSIQAFNPSPDLIDYAMTKAAQVAFVRALAEDLGPRGIRVNAVAPGPIWTPLIPGTGWDAEKVTSFGSDTPLGRAGQPVELAGAYVYLASEAASYTSGAVLPVTGGKHL
ncbi:MULTISPECIES: SDR family oxidoreductase [unclassified Microbacterium]|uniref:SDR family oxidoreductase n=1 Tax=unclassified Microbacterium TaxID=2609290 RepID=UPI00386787D9